MPDYHRTQIQLETRQYERLKERAAEEDISLSELIRRLVDKELAQERQTGRHKLLEIAGKWEDPEFSGEDHDEILYGGDL